MADAQSRACAEEHTVAVSFAQAVVWAAHALSQVMCDKLELMISPCQNLIVPSARSHRASQALFDSGMARIHGNILCEMWQQLMAISHSVIAVH